MTVTEQIKLNKMKKLLIFLLFWIWNPMQFDRMILYGVNSIIVDFKSNLISKNSIENVSIVPRKTQYNVNEEVIIDFYGFPGNPKDWISITKSGSKDNEYITFKFLEGKISGTITLPGQLPGVYEIRGYYNNEYTVRARANIQFGLSGDAVNLTLNKTNFNPKEEIAVNYSGFPGNAKDWIAISKAGSPDNEYITFKFVEGKYSGSMVLPGQSPGAYEIRGYFNNEYTVRTRKSIQVGETGLTAKVICTKTVFAPGEEIIIDFSGFPGNDKDWIAIAKTGTADNSYITYKFLEGKTSGRITLPAQVAGNYEIRGYFNNEYTVRSRCQINVADNTLGSKLTLDKTQFTPGEKITVYFTASATYPENAWVGMFPANIQHGSEALNDQHELAYQYLSKKTSGTLTFNAPAKDGNYDFRMHDTDDNGKEVTYIAFTVASNVGISNPTLTLDKTQFTPGEKITVYFTASATYPENAWVGMFPANIQHGSEALNDQHELAYQYLSKKTSGTLTFNAPAKDGNYDFRMHDTDDNGKEVTYIAFTVASNVGISNPTLTLDKTQFTPGEKITVYFTSPATYPENAWVGMFPANIQHGSEALNDQHELAYQYLSKKTSGTLTFNAPAKDGNYDFRMHDTDDNGKEVAQIAFVVLPKQQIPVLTLNKTEYLPGEEIVVTFSGFAGNAKDWIAVATVGSADNAYITYKFLEGKKSGSITLPAQGAGSYEVRGYFNNEYTVKVKTTFKVIPPEVTAKVICTKSVFAPTEDVVIDFSGFPGNAKDWIAIAKTGTADNSYTTYKFLEGKTSGRIILPAQVAGNYEIRGYFNNEYTVRSRCQISITKSVDIDLTGLWVDDKGSTYKIRQTGNDVYWFMDDFMIRTQLFIGKINNNIITGNWVDLPYSEKLLKGTAVYKINNNNNVICNESIPNMGVQYITREIY
jgi:hypothetical protein